MGVGVDKGNSGQSILRITATCDEKRDLRPADLESRDFRQAEIF